MRGGASRTGYFISIHFTVLICVAFYELKEWFWREEEGVFFYCMVIIVYELLK